MPLFTWEPEGSTRRVSPWLGLYGITTILLTSVTILWFKIWAAPSAERIRKSLEKELDVETESTKLAKLRFLRDSMAQGSSDIELGQVTP